MSLLHSLDGVVQLAPKPLYNWCGDPARVVRDRVDDFHEVLLPRPQHHRGLGRGPGHQVAELVRGSSVEVEHDEIWTEAVDLPDDRARTVLLTDDLPARLGQHPAHPHAHDGTEIPEQDARPAGVVHPPNHPVSAEFPARAIRAPSAARSVMRASCA